MTTVESNKLIAQFMGGKIHNEVNFKLKENEMFIPVHGIARHDTLKLGSGPTIKYHKSWDWLIPVIQFINENHKSTLVKTNFMNNVSSLIIVNDIHHAFEEVVNYIRKHNETNPSHS